MFFFDHSVKLHHYSSNHVAAVIFYCFLSISTIAESHRVRHISRMQLTDFQHSIQSTALDAAYQAGDIMLRGSGLVNLRSDITSKIGSRDVVTEYDTACQKSIKSIILSKFPDHSFLGEEDVPPGIEASTAACKAMMQKEHLWIVDPIDGTTNFAHGMPLSGVIIGYASKGELQFGCIYDPYHKELYTTWRGKGAYLNNQPIRCCETETLQSSVICTGSPPNIDALDACLRVTNRISSKVRTMRMIGSAAIMLAWVACGRVSAYVETDLNVWDLAVGCLLVQEAGGMVSDVWGDTYSLETRNLVSSNGLIHSQLLEELQQAKMWMPVDNEKSMKRLGILI
mmetsp:Transcript_40455/g.41272  ORF Transcript_40455/g.41272 Transcript_40455/m.41272 type:complete len:340 (+) Transcript_40455:126-1145(+)